MIDKDGYLVMKGRLKEMIKTGGMNVAPAEVEGILRAHGMIAEAFVTSLPDAERSEQVVAIVVPREAAGLTVEAVIADCRGSLAAFKVPRRIRFATLEEIPLTTTGKLHRDRLKELFQ